MRNTSNIGNKGEAKTLSKLASMDVHVYLPFGDGCVADMLAVFNNNINKIQVKTTEKLQDGNLMIWKTTHQDGYHGSKKRYTKDEVDYFSFYCVETDTVYLVPYDNVTGDEFRIRLDTYSGRRLKTMHFEKDYMFENFIDCT